MPELQQNFPDEIDRQKTESDPGGPPEIGHDECTEPPGDKANGIESMSPIGNENFENTSESSSDTNEIDLPVGEADSKSEISSPGSSENSRFESVSSAGTDLDSESGGVPTQPIEKKVPDISNELVETDPGELPEREETADELAHVIEAIIFASDEPLPPLTIKSVLDAAHTFGRVSTDSIVSRIRALNENYETSGSGFRIVEVANGYQFATRKDMAQWVSNLFRERSKRRLSNSALETLAIIAYKQPVTKPEIESIRGVNIDYVLHNLLEKEIVTVVGRAETVGRPLLYGTTQKFLKIFGLKNLDDLPKLREIEEIIREIKSKGAEESIQLEITALDDQAISENKNGSEAISVPPTTDGSE